MFSGGNGFKIAAEFEFNSESSITEPITAITFEAKHRSAYTEHIILARLT
jgi:hypothetical protein